MTIRVRFVYSYVVCVASLFLLASAARAQSVTTWHNDNYRTGEQLAETILSPSTSWSNFGLLWQYSAQGNVYAQPLAVTQVASPNCPTPIPTPCDMVFVATEEDMLYGFDAKSSLQLWSANLAQLSTPDGTYLDCRLEENPCQPNGIIYPYWGVTGTPVIDPNAGILYVVALVVVGTTPYPTFQYYLHAINITNGNEEPNSPIEISASVPGLATSPGECTTGVGPGPLSFDPLQHLQRTGLLLLNLSSGSRVVYVAFAPLGDHEVENGWIMGYTYTSSGQNSGFNQVAAFATTPYGTGGGVWEAGAGLASDGSYIYAPTGNGTFDALYGGSEYGDSMLKLNVDSISGALSVSGYFTPSDWDERCEYNDMLTDIDFGSGGVLLFPDSFFQGHPHLMVSSDKESYLWFVDRDNPGGVNGQLQQSLQPSNPPQGSTPGYWSSGTYWNSGTAYNLYYGVDEKNLGIPPWPIYEYQLQSSGSPISSGGPSGHTATLFCGNPHVPTPSISANESNGGLLWAIESSNSGNPLNCRSVNIGPAVLHVYNAIPASGILNELYNSSGVLMGNAVHFPVPTIFKGRVYVGTTTEVDVFGLQ